MKPYTRLRVPLGFTSIGVQLPRDKVLVPSHSAPSLLVIDAEQLSALAAVRSLGRHDVPVLAAGEGTRAFAGASRYVLAYLNAPPPSTQPRLFVDWLVNEVASREIGFVLPVTEVPSQLLLPNREGL